MPIRFRRTIKVAPGIKLNLSKSGVSTTVGPRGFHFTFGKRGIRRTIGIPGTGISETDYIEKNETKAEKAREAGLEKKREEGIEGPRDDKSENVTRRRTRSVEPSAQQGEAAAAGASGLRTAFIIVGALVFFVVGASALGLIPAHFLSNSLQFLSHMAQSTGH